MIKGTVEDGKGSVTRHVKGERLERRRRACGMPLVPGSLNLGGRPEDLLAAVGEPTVLIEHDHRLGSLRCWPVLLHSEHFAAPVAAYYIRHLRSQMTHMEFCSDVHLRSLGLENGDVVRVQPL